MEHKNGNPWLTIFTPQDQPDENYTAAYVAREEADAVANDLEAAKNNAYTERNALAFALARAVTAEGGKAYLQVSQTLTDKGEVEWPILYVETQGKQWSWHIPMEEVKKQMILPQVVLDHTWDGTTTEEKYQQLAVWQPKVVLKR